uniref:C3H1-type domain-containing protein n=1 Tax=viral metagenome TaxID=1070528 RepID=A0A6C0AX98_9ZZZZ|tara:strand:- start:1278 stop:1676 length:399 start_codon:yes stop_codon:yes gene_type:complete
MKKSHKYKITTRLIKKTNKKNKSQNFSTKTRKYTRKQLKGRGRGKGKPVIKDHQKYKTVLCKTFEKTGSCPYGNKCQFAHGIHELRISSPLPGNPSLPPGFPKNLSTKDRSNQYKSMRESFRRGETPMSYKL